MWSKHLHPSSQILPFPRTWDYEPPEKIFFEKLKAKGEISILYSKSSEFQNVFTVSFALVIGIAKNN